MFIGRQVKIPFERAYAIAASIPEGSEGSIGAGSRRMLPDFVAAVRSMNDPTEWVNDDCRVDFPEISV